jgi:hypothetical protein
VPIDRQETIDPIPKEPRAASARRDLAVALAVKGTLGEQGPDGGDQLGVGHRPGRARRRPRSFHDRLTPAVDSGAGDAPDAADLRQAIGPAGGGRDDGAHPRGPHAILIA